MKKAFEKFCNMFRREKKTTTNPDADVWLAAVETVMAEMVPNEAYKIIAGEENEGGTLIFEIETTSPRALVAWSEVVAGFEELKKVAHAQFDDDDEEDEAV